MNQPTFLEVVTALGAVATPILVLLLAGVGWRLRKRLERRFEREDRQRTRRLELEDKLRGDRIAAYNEILEPFILFFMTEQAWLSDPKNKNKDRHQIASRKLLSLEHRQQSFKLALVGSDSVVAAYNDLMQFFFSSGEVQNPQEAHVKEMMRLVGRFLLEIRRSMGNEDTGLSEWQMLEWFLTDARKYGGQGEAGNGKA